MKKYIYLFTIFISTVTFSQDVLMQTGTVNQCSGTFYDSGGMGGNYSSNENFTLTICPDVAGNYINIDFTSFSTQMNSDVLEIFDGPDTASPSFGVYSGGTMASNPGSVTATEGNTSGCLTFQFISDASGITTGWEATISCFEYCQTIVSQIDSASPSPNGDGYIRVCTNEAIMLTGSGNFSVDPSGATYEWDLGDGNTISGQSATFSYSTPGVYIVNLDIRDDNTFNDPLGCPNTNLINQVVQVGTTPDFTGTDAAQSTLCFGDTTTITGVVTPTEFINDCTPPVSGVTVLPDQAGATYETTVTVDCYDASLVLTDVNQIVSVCINLEHSYSGDLDIVLISPTGQQLQLYNQGGGGTYFGGANNLDNQVPGIGAEYCFNASAAVTVNNGATVIAGSNPPGPSWAPDTYLPTGNFNTLLGSPLNGDWTLQLVDNLSIDDGTVFGWSIEFDPNLQPPELSFTPTTVTESWDPDPTITNTTGNTITVAPPVAGQYCYTYRTTDDFGCEYTEQVCIDVLPELVIAPPNNLFLCNPSAPPYSFDLSQNTPIITAPFATPGDLNVSYYETQMDADNEVNAIPSPTMYNSSATIGLPQTIFVRVEYLTSDCYETETFTLNITSQPVINAVPDLELCDDASNDGTEPFDLETQSAAILGTQSSSDYSVTYYTNLTDATAGLNALVSPYDNISNPEPIFVRVQLNTDVMCFSVTTSPSGEFNLIVNPRDNADFSMTSSCDGGTAIITGDLGGVFSFNPLPTDGAILDANTGAVANGTSGATYTIEYTTSGVCPETSTQMVTINTEDDASFTMEATCDGGIATVTGLAGGTFSFNPVPTDGAVLDTNTGTITGGTSGTTYTIEYMTNGACPTTTSQNVMAYPQPVVVNPSPLEICDDNIPDGFTAIDLTIKNNEISGGNAAYLITYHASQTDADNKVNPLPIPYTNTTNPQTVFVRVEDGATSCYDTTSLDLMVEQAPIAFTPNDLEYCDPDNDGFGVFTLTDADAEVTGGAPGLTVSYHETMADAENAINSLTSPYTNLMANTQTIYVRVESATIATGCPSFVELQLIVNPTPQIAVLTPLEVCDDDQDGFNQFDFEAEITPQILTGTQTAADFTLSYHTTQGDADSGNNPIVNTTNYTNQSNPQTIYIRLVSNSNGCVTTAAFNIVVVLPPVLDPVYDNELSQCDDLDANYMENNDGITSFDLTVEDAEIVNGNSSWIVAYYESQADALAATNAIPDATAYTNTMTGSQTLYIRVTDNDTGCFSFSTVTLRVLPNPSPSPNPADLILCDDTNTGDLIEAFDLTQNETFIINGEAGVTASYYTNQTDAITANNAIADPTIHTNEDPNTAGVGLTPQTIYVRVTNGDDATGLNGTGCFSLVSFDVIVNPLPVVTPVMDYIICELNTDGVADFNLDSMTLPILNGQDPAVFRVTYHETLLEAETAMNALSSPYANTSNPQTIYVNITNMLTGCDVATLTFTIEVQEAAQANPDGVAIVYEVCDDNMEFDTNPGDDMAEFDLTTQNLFVLDGQDPVDYTVSYYATQTDADAATNPLPFTYTNTINPQVIIVRVDNDTLVDDGTGTGNMIDSSTCYETAEVTLQVNPIPPFNLEDTYVLCVNTNGTEVISAPLLDTGLNATDYTFEWFYEGNTISGETTPSLIPTVGGNYAVVVTDISTSLNTMCTSADTTLVALSEPPVVSAEVTSLAFADQHDIRVTTTTMATASIALFEFSLDGGPWEVNTPNDNTYTFTDVGAGEHTITVRDYYGCGESSITIIVMDYPLYFTPNNDGYNDTWNIYAIDTQPDAVIYIYDRYGKLLKQLSPTGAGWDGTYNGHPMPTSDYWFSVEYREPNTDERKAFRAHFTLKR